MSKKAVSKSKAKKSSTLHPKLDTQVNSLTGYAILLVILMVGFFVLYSAN